MLRRIAAGAGRRGQWHLMLADILSQINGRKHATTQVAPNLAYSDPEMAEIALRNIERRAKHKVTRPEIKVGDMVRIRVKPIESRGSYRVNEIAWSEKVYRVASAESGEMEARTSSWYREVADSNPACPHLLRRVTLRGASTIQLPKGALAPLAWLAF